MSNQPVEGVNVLRITAAVMFWLALPVGMGGGVGVYMMMLFMPGTRVWTCMFVVAVLIIGHASRARAIGRFHVLSLYFFLGLSAYGEWWWTGDACSYQVTWLSPVYIAALVVDAVLLVICPTT